MTSPFVISAWLFPPDKQCFLFSEYTYMMTRGQQSRRGLSNSESWQNIRRELRRENGVSHTSSESHMSSLVVIVMFFVMGTLVHLIVEYDSELARAEKPLHSSYYSRRVGKNSIGKSQHHSARAPETDKLNFLNSPVPSQMSPHCNYTCPVNLTLLPNDGPLTALASYPGSGNTWMREMLQQLTGYHVNSIYCDKSLQPVFPSECLLPSIRKDKCNENKKLYSRFLAIKTHFPDLRFPIDNLFERAIVLIRSPTEAIFSLAHLQFTKSHVEVAPDSHFTGEKYYRSLKPLCLKWKKFYSYWLGYQKYQSGPVFNGPVFPVLYDHLKSGGSASRKEVLGHLSQFLELNEKHLFVNCTDCEGAASYFRNRPSKSKHRYSLKNDSIAMEILASSKCLAMYEEIVLQYTSARVIIQSTAELVKQSVPV